MVEKQISDKQEEKVILSVVDRIISPSPLMPANIHVLTPGTCEYVTLQGKRDFAHVIS